MKKFSLIIGVIAIGIGYLLISHFYKPEVKIEKPENVNMYKNTQAGFSITLPDGYSTEENYKYQELGPGKDIIGTKFTIPKAIASGTNLSEGSYISVEELPNVKVCKASLFLDQNTQEKNINENNVLYSFAQSMGAGAGNRYEESVYVISGTNPCIAIRYFIHYGVIENYPQGVVKEFDKQALLKQFDRIRSTLILNK